MSEEDHWSRDLASRLEALLEIGGTALAASGIFLALRNLPTLQEGLLGLAPGFGGRDTGAFLCAVLGGLIVMPLLLRRLLDGETAAHLLGRRRTSMGKAVGAGLMAAAALTLWSQFLLWLAPEILLPAWRDLDVTDAPRLWTAILFAAPLATALPEELFFRGYCQGMLTRRCGRAWGLALAAGGFSLAHAGQGWVAVAVAVLPAAVVLGLLYDATGSILAPWVAHTVTNAATFICLGSAGIYPGASTWIVAGVLALATASLWLGRRQAPAARQRLQEMGRLLLQDQRGFLLSATAGLAAMATVIAVYGVLAPYLEDDAARVLATGLTLWVLALGIHHRRGGSWGAGLS